MPQSQFPDEVAAVLRSSFTCEFTTLTRHGDPLTWPTEPFLDEQSGEIVVTASIAFPVKAFNARRNRRVSLLFSDPTGSGLQDSPAVLVQGDASVAESLEWTSRSEKQFYLSVTRQPDSQKFVANRFARRFFSFYFQRLTISVRPRRMLVWPRRDFAQAPYEIDADALGAGDVE
jgi:hypothetical protein